MNKLKVYIAGKVSKNSIFGKHHWRDEFCDALSEKSGVKLESLDPLKNQAGDTSPDEIFATDCRLINQSDCVIVYLSDDISVGGSQEILIAKYLKKPVIGFAPHGGKFNGCTKEMMGVTIHDYKDPFVFATCDVVCGTVEEVAEALPGIMDIEPKTLAIIDQAIKQGA